ncbi:hypothetical protein EH222_05855 [candidate division KSB1 bacterium]|nr:MAG: hypothetical protein EH222_05855 [candidate division KSB1 bacterium]
MNIMSLFMSMDKMLGPDFERGLTLLKERVEAKAAKMANLEIKKMKYPSTAYAAIRSEIKMNDIKSFFESSYAAINMAMEGSGATMAGAPVGLFFKWDEENGVADVAAGIPTRKRVETDEVQIFNLPEASALYIDFYGPFEETELAHWALMKYCEKSGIAIRGPVVEQYLTDPASEPDPDKWLTRVIYIL